MNLDKVDETKAEKTPDEHDQILKQYENLYDVEKRHQHDIKLNNQFKLQDYDQGKKDKKLK